MAYVLARQMDALNAQALDAQTRPRWCHHPPPRCRYATGPLTPAVDRAIRAAKEHHMTNTPVDIYRSTLAEWWDDAETGPVREGDTFIRRTEDDEHYAVGIAPADLGEWPQRRVLKRARPAWQDAPAVMAHTQDRPERRAFIYHPDTGEWWDNSDFDVYRPEDLIDPQAMTVAA